MKTLIESLERLSEAAYEALPLLEKYDYRKEADNYDDNKLELRVIPRLLQDILNSMLKYCAPIEHNGERIPDAALLNADNMRRFTENLNISGDWTSLRQLNHIDLEPIKDIKDLLEEIGLSHQARLLENVCSFAANLRSHSRSHSLRPASTENETINIQVTLSPEELTDAELQPRQPQRFIGKPQLFVDAVHAEILVAQKGRVHMRELCAQLMRLGGDGLRLDAAEAALV